MEPERAAAKLTDRIYEAVLAGGELIAMQAGYRFGWYASLARHGPLTAEELSELSETGPRFTTEWLRQQTVAGVLHADLSGNKPTFRISAEVAEVLLGTSGTGENTMAALMTETFAESMQTAQRLVEAWRYDRSGLTSTDRATLSRQQARYTALTASDLPRQLAAVPELAGVLARKPLRIAELGCGAGLHLAAMAASWPAAELVGYELDAVALALAEQRHEPGSRVSLRRADARRVIDDAPFDLILAVDALHDMRDPADVLAAARLALAGEGAIVIAESPYPEEFTGKPNPAERTGYLASLFNCLHQQVDHSGVTAVGAVVRESDVRAWGTAAGLPPCTVHDNDAGALRVFLFRAA